jgi:hypothetical protein
MRHWMTTLGFAAATAAATLAVCWPSHTYADPPETFYQMGEVENVSFTGELARDKTVKSGWAIKVTYTNQGDEEEPCTLDTELTRAQVNPASRASPPGVAVWHRRDKVMVPAHESVVKNYEVPQWVAVQLTSNEKAAELRQKQIDRENAKPAPNYALEMRPYTMYTVAFQKAAG